MKTGALSLATFCFARSCKIVLLVVVVVVVAIVVYLLREFS